MTATGSVDLAIEGTHGRAVRVPRHTYTDTAAGLIDVWVIDSDTALPPYRQFVVGVAQTGSIVPRYRFRVGAVAVGAQPIRPAEGFRGARVAEGEIASHTFHGDDQTARDLCRTIAGNLVDGRLPIGAAPRAWELVLAGTVHLIEQARREADIDPFLGARGPDRCDTAAATVGDDVHATYRRGFVEGDRQGREHGQRIAAAQTEAGATAYEQGRALGINAAAHWVNTFVRADLEGFDRNTLTNIHTGLCAMAHSARERLNLPGDDTAARLTCDEWWEGYTAGCAMSHAVGCDAVEAERDQLQEEIDAALESLEYADPVVHEPPLTIAQRIRALGDRRATGRADTPYRVGGAMDPQVRYGVGETISRDGGAA